MMKYVWPDCGSWFEHIPIRPLTSDPGARSARLGEVTINRQRSPMNIWVFVSGAAVGLLGGMIGLGGAEFRLPLLIGVFGFAALQAVILNKAMSLIVVVTALPARIVSIPLDDLRPHLSVVFNLLAGTLIGSWLGASAATRMRAGMLNRVLAVLLAVIAAVLVGTHLGTTHQLGLSGPALVVAGVIAGLLIGAVAAVMGVAGGELLIPTIVLLYGIGVKVAGSLSLMVSLPTMIVAFARYSQDGSFRVLKGQRRFLAVMAAGSIAGTIIGGLLVGAIPESVLIPVLGTILVVSAIKVWQHQTSDLSPLTQSDTSDGLPRPADP